MSQRGMVIDSLEFARRHGTLSGRLQLGSLPRLGEVLFDASGSLSFDVIGETVGSEAFLALKLGGQMRLTCQRCLGAFEFALSASNRLLLIEAGSPWPDAGQVGGLEDEVCDAIEASREMDLVPLIEEEILLALPISPKHERCERPESVAASVEGSPFARLARLKRS
ncbi:MAG: metal-binding protein [Betaproteobacteria bacterium HGW-Betaproteobacteria-14]|nr:MAG: metal-binding protein [Betaproteobacteria bacterium HGW-Betaproteobacteria-14]